MNEYLPTITRCVVSKRAGSGMLVTIFSLMHGHMFKTLKMLTYFQSTTFQRKELSWDIIILLLFFNNVIEERHSEIIKRVMIDLSRLSPRNLLYQKQTFKFGKSLLLFCLFLVPVIELQSLHLQGR